MGGYSTVEQDVIREERDGSVSPMRVCREMARNASINGATRTAALFDEACAEVNRENHRGNAYRDALRYLLYALHAGTDFGRELPTVEEAIAEAQEVMERYRPGPTP